jgi:hypothetical protein
MKKVFPLLGALMLVSLLVGLNGCILQTTEITIVITDFVCTGFEENHDSENYTDETVTFDDSFFDDLDAILADNDMTKDDIEAVSVVGVFYQVTDGPTAPPAPATNWTVSGRIWIQVDGGPLVLIAEYQPIVLTGPMTDPVAIDTNDAGLAALDAALEDYLAGGYPTIVFWADRETGDIDPTPTGVSPFIMEWNGCVSMEVDFVEEYDIYDLFPGE